MPTIDFETKSYADLQKTGAWVYSQDPTTDLICMTWTRDGESWEEWWPDHACPEFGLPECKMVKLENGKSMPEDLYLAILKGEIFEAHNQPFEYSIWVNVLARRYGWMVPYDHSWRDTMAVARYKAMPAQLDRLARSLGYPGKDPEGGRLISKYSKLHLKTAVTKIPPEDFEKELNYCGWDSCLEFRIGRDLGVLPEEELRIWQIDFEINRRGLYLDAKGIAAAADIVDQRAAELEKEFKKLTGGLKPGQHAKVMNWFGVNGLKLDNLQADYLEELMEEGDIPNGPARRALEIRLLINKASTKKLDAMARQRDSKGRARFQTSYHGALTGRDTGSGFQPLNLNRGYEDVDPDQLVRDIMYRNERYLTMLYGNSMDAIGKASRHWIMAEKGSRLMAVDFSNIEARALACLAGEEWKVEAFHRGDPIYELMGCKIHKLPQSAIDLAREDKDAFKEKYPAERFDGKTGELAFGYQGALGAWLKFDSSGRHSDEQIIANCRAWRAEHPAIVQFWYDLEDAAIECVQDGVETCVGEIGFAMHHEWLTMILPDGKRIWYREPQLRSGMPKWHQPETKEDCADGSCNCRPQLKLTYLSYKNKQFRRVYTYGGKLAENATQATCRQILVPAILRAEKYGYPVILKVYDEIVAEVPKGFGSAEEFHEIVCEKPAGSFFEDWPIEAGKPYVGRRYKKG